FESHPVRQLATDFRSFFGSELPTSLDRSAPPAACRGSQVSLVAPRLSAAQRTFRSAALTSMPVSSNNIQFSGIPVLCWSVASAAQAPLAVATTAPSSFKNLKSILCLDSCREQY